MVWSFSVTPTVVQSPSVAEFVEHIFNVTSDVEGPPIVEVVEVEYVAFTVESLVADICVPVAPVPATANVNAEVVLVTLGTTGIVIVSPTPAI